MSLAKIAYCLVPALIGSGLAWAQPPANPGSAPPEMMGHPHRDPAAMHRLWCSDRSAMHAGHLAYLEAKLELTDSQKPLFNKWRQILLDSAQKEKASCLSAGAKGPWGGNVIERETREQALLTAKLQSLQASLPALQALYDGLTPTQRDMFDHGMQPHGGHGHHGWSKRHGDGPPMPQDR